MSKENNLSLKLKPKSGIQVTSFVVPKSEPTFNLLGKQFHFNLWEVELTAVSAIITFTHSSELYTGAGLQTVTQTKMVST